MRPNGRLMAAAGLAGAALLLASSFRTASPAFSRGGARGAAGAELHAHTVAAWEAYATRATAEFRERVSGAQFLWSTADPARRRELARGEIVVAAADGDGILDVPDGLIHHWIAGVYIPDVSLRTVLSEERSYEQYPRIHEPILKAELLSRQGDTDRILLRIEQRTTFVHAVLDTWWLRTHGRPAPDRAFVIAAAERIQQVEDAGTPDERRLPVGEGGGYLWHGRTYMRMLEQDGGTYVEFQTLGLSRGFPRFLGWIAEPIVRRIGRGSVERTLDEIRSNLLSDRNLSGRAATVGCSRLPGRRSWGVGRCRARQAAGRLTLKTDPCPGVLSASTRPP